MRVLAQIGMVRTWDYWVEEALARLESLKVLRSLRPIYIRSEKQRIPINNELQFLSNPKKDEGENEEFEVFDEMRQWDRSSVEVEIGESTFQRWMHDTPSSGNPFSLLFVKSHEHDICSFY